MSAQKPRKNTAVFPTPTPFGYSLFRRGRVLIARTNNCPSFAKRGERSGGSSSIPL